MSGWIKLHRKMAAHWMFSEPEAVALWVRLLMDANYTDKVQMFNGQLIEVKRGQLIFGRSAYSAKTNISESKIRRYLKLFKSDQMIDQLATSRYSVITVLSYDSYQQSDQLTTSSQPADDQLATTPKESKERNTVKQSIPFDEIFDLYDKNIKDVCNAKGFFRDGFLKNGSRVKHLVARWTENPKHQDIRFWDDYFNRCAKVSWIREGINGEAVCDIDKLVNKTKFYKFVEEFYA